MSKNFWPDTQRVEHAGFTVDLAPAAIRNLTFEGAQIIDLLYAAIRPEDWSTLTADQHNEDVQLSGEDCIITINDIYLGALHGKTILTLRPGGRFTVRYQLVGLGKFAINRWGISFCLDTGDWMGSKVLADEDSHVLSKEIAPQRVIDGITKGIFPAANSLHFTAPDQRSLKVISAGRLLEAEDQRNWTDNTYKIYSGSLGEPRPFLIEEGVNWEQTVEFEVTPPAAPWEDGSKIIARDIPSLPRIGLQFNSEPLLASDDLEKALVILDIDHIRVNEESLSAQKMILISLSISLKSLSCTNI
jgi:hypothetical protein